MLATVIPFFQFRVLGSPFAGAFSSYLYIAHNSSAFIFLAHATAVSKSVSWFLVTRAPLLSCSIQSSPTRQTRLTIRALLLLAFLSTLGTLVPTTPNLFFTLIILVAVLSAVCVSYLQPPVFAVASIFGPREIQAVMAGQAAVGVVVNLVQFVSAAISLRSKSGQSGRTPEEISAFVCFAFATCLLCVSLVAHSWLVRTPAYKILIVPIEQRITRDNLEERRALLWSSDVSHATNPKKETPRERIVRVARANVISELAVAYVFIVTLVCSSFESRKFASLYADILFAHYSPSSRLSQRQSCPSTLGFIRFSSTPSTSSCLAWATCWGGTSALFPPF